MRSFIIPAIPLLLISGPCAYAQRQVETPALDSPNREHAISSFRQYAAAVEHRISTNVRFLWVASDSSTRQRLRAGQILAFPAKSLGISAPVSTVGGQIQHWAGSAFVPGITLAQALPILQDYSNRPRFMAPEIAESELLQRSEDEFLVRLRIVEHSILSGTFDARLRIVYRALDAARLAIDSRSESVTEVASAGLPPPKDRGILWALNYYWRIQEADGGLYLECEALVLSRKPPAMLKWIAAPLISQASRKTLVNELAATRKMLESAAAPK
jgi:hypothetical protein